MGQDVTNQTRFCQIPQGSKKGLNRHLRPRTIFIAVSLVAILSTSALLNYMTQSALSNNRINIQISFSMKPDRFDVFLLDIDTDGNHVRNVTYDTNIRSNHIPFWGKITELTTGGFGIAGYQEKFIVDSDSPDRQLWVIRTDENYNPLWNRTYGKTLEIRSITEMNNGDIAIGHYIEDYGYQESTFQILVIDDEGEYVREQSWNFSHGWCSGFSQCDDGGFIIAKEIYNTPASPFWIARIDTDLSVIWNKTYPDFATHSDIVEDIAGGFTMPLDGPIGIVRLDYQGNEISTVIIDSTAIRKYLTLTQLSNGEYLLGGPGYISRFNIEGDVLWEMDVDFYVHGIQELNLNRFVAFKAAGVRENDWNDPGVYLECFDTSGTTIWNCSIQTTGFFVPDIIYNTDGGLTILGMVASNYLSSLLGGLPTPTDVGFDRTMILLVAGEVVAIVVIVLVVWKARERN